MWLFHRKNESREEFDSEFSLFEESVEVESDSMEDQYMRIASLITNQDERVLNLIEILFNFSDDFENDIQVDEEESFFEDEEKDYWQLLLELLERELYLVRMYWSDTPTTVFNKLQQLSSLENFDFNREDTPTGFDSTSSYLDFQAKNFLSIGKILCCIELDEDNSVLFCISSDCLLVFSQLMDEIEQPWRQIL